MEAFPPLTRTLSWDVFRASPTGKETLGKPQDVLGGLSADRSAVGFHQQTEGSFCEEGGLSIFAWAAVSTTWSPKKHAKMDVRKSYKSHFSFFLLKKTHIF